MRRALPLTFKNFLAIAAVLAVGACATEARYAEILDGFVGMSERELVERFGPPDSVYTLEETKFLTYRVDRTIFVPDLSPRFRSVRDDRAFSRQFGGTAPRILNQFCKTSFTIEDATVGAWRAEGNDCRA